MPDEDLQGGIKFWESFLGPMGELWWARPRPWPAKLFPPKTWTLCDGWWTNGLLVRPREQEKIAWKHLSLLDPIVEPQDKQTKKTHKTNQAGKPRRWARKRASWQCLLWPMAGLSCSLLSPYCCFSQVSRLVTLNNVTQSFPCVKLQAQQILFKTNQTSKPNQNLLNN